ncbi:ABC transporter ATP-binding protein [Agathobaculum sp.]|uniref:ABC transporter ATP-binding protein n=1 Tax=Agathobaculum sp. TaxID=2048138 RepID=UPI002A8226CC|nr:ABC transporter ATP-binding protein [Agathobaculum sp.]MDY3617612.1 ABC transporter ATP-binding protein [Agathobaculum sp.]
MLEIKNLHAYYGPIEALKGIDVSVANDSITCLIGSNGAGKTTLLKSISGMIHRTGSIELDGLGEITGKNSRQIARAGLIHVPEGRHVFPGLTVRDNLETGTINWHGFFGRQSYRDELEEVYALFPRLKERENQLGWSLSGGEQQMLAIGRALMARPKVLMLDEPSMGLAPLVIAELFEKIVEVNRTRHIPILLVEQNARLALDISDQAYIIDGGRVILEGKAADLKHDDRVVQAYLGKFAAGQ